MSTLTKVFNSGYSLAKLNAQRITMMAVVLAARIILSYVPGLRFGDLAEIGVGFIGTAFSGILFGPVYAFIISALNDVITFFLTGWGPFFPGFTLGAGIAGWIYGAFLWRKEVTWKRVFLAVLCVTLIVNLGLTSLWVKILTGQAWQAIMGVRLVKNLVSLPLNTIILYIFLQAPAVARMIRQYRF